ncbi:DUF4391 domain-containing protein [Sulfurimonas sp. HSL1-2]|uniref:DUF4391 domain-containing protein n=1 Tax=Thiomicrolovo zhangzhouensis TaxID=3131933 RepID=UPI0031F8FEC9
MQAYFGRVIPKSKIYEHGSVNTAMREKFIAQIDKIIWSYKLAPETINLAASESVPEIQVFDVFLKANELGEDVLRVLDKAIPFPIIYQIHRNDQVKVKAAYKRPSESDKRKWVIESYFESEWLDSEDPKIKLPVALNLIKLYEQMIQFLMPIDIRDQPNQGSLKDQVDKIQLIKAKEREYEKLKAKRDKEQQFNRKAELNSQLKLIKKELDELRQ